MTEQVIDIGGRLVGAGMPTYVIAEAGVNHNGSLEMARALIDVAAEAGADAVKFQTFDPAALASTGAPLAEYQHPGAGESGDQREMLAKLALSSEEFRALAEHAASRGIEFLSTPFDEGSVDLLRNLGVRAVKLGSGELTNTPFLEQVAGLGLPMLLSTGMSDLGEIGEALGAVERGGDPPVVLLHCVSSYPTPPDQANLRAMGTLRERFGLPVGYSDHCLGADVSLAAVALGAVVLERHVTLDTTLPGPDHAMSMVPAELADLVRRVRVLEVALGDGRKTPQPAELDTRAVARRSLVATRDLRPGDVIDDAAIAAKRPGGGLAPGVRWRLVGRAAVRTIQADEPFVEADLRAEVIDDG